MFDPDQILSHYNPATGELAGAKPTERFLTDLRGSFADAEAYEAALEAYVYNYPLVYFARLRAARMLQADPVSGVASAWGAWSHRSTTVPRLSRMLAMTLRSPRVWARSSDCWDYLRAAS